MINSKRIPNSSFKSKKGKINKIFQIRFEEGDLSGSPPFFQRNYDSHTPLYPSNINAELDEIMFLK